MRSAVATGSSCAASCALCDALRDAVPAAVAAQGLPDLSLEVISRFASIDPGVARDHLPVGAWHLVVAAFEQAADGLLAEYEAGFAGAESWSDGIEAALTRVVTRLVERPTVANLCFVAVLHADLELRERRRRHFVGFLTGEYHRRQASGETLPPLQFELVSGGIFRTVAAFVQQRRLQEPISDLVEELVQGVRVFEPAPA
jgi:hypothetical protein